MSIAKTMRFPGGLTFTTIRGKSSDSKLGATFHLELPQLRVAGKPANAFSAGVQQKLRHQMTEFQRTAADYRRDDTASRKYSLESTYRIVTATPRIVSVLLDFTIDYSGAHPGSTSEAVNYDVRQGKVLRLADLFSPGANWLPVLSGESRRLLKVHLHSDDSTVSAGTTPAEKNFRVWSLVPRGLQITFPPYQVASYAEGEQHVIIPLARLRSLMRPEYAGGF